MEAAKPVSASVLYLYGLLRAGADTSDVEAIEEASLVFLIEHGGIACAATIVPASQYDRRLDGRPEDVAWLAPRAWRHHDVLRRLHMRTAVVPLKFGTLCAGMDDVRAMLERLGPTVTDLLSRIEARDEWTLRIAANEPAILAGLASDSDVRRLQQDVERLPEGRAYFARKQLQKATADRVAAFVDDIEAAVSGRLAALGAEVAHMPRPRRGDRERSADAETAILVPRSAFGDVEESLRVLEDAHGAQVRFELVGPWPPYSFASISQSMPPAYDSHSPL